MGFESTKLPVNHGVPQGSVLGPLLFLIYINDLHSAIIYSRVYHFADDTNLLNINISAKKIQKQVNIDLKLLYNWLLANKISLNCTKTEIIFFGKASMYQGINIKMNGLRLRPSDSIKYLGVHLDADLSGKTHCQQVATKLKRASGMPSKTRHYIPINELLSVYYAIFSSHMSYACQVWGQINKSVIRRITKLQNRVMRIISFSDFGANPDPIYKSLKVLKFCDFVSLQNCLFVYDFLNQKLPTCFAEFFTPISQKNSKMTKNVELGCLFIHHSNTTKHGLSSTNRQCINSWNFLSRTFNTNLRSLNRSALKRKIVSHFLSSY